MADQFKKLQILSVKKMANADQIAINDLLKQGRSGADLMEEAGLSVVRQITEVCDGSRVIVLCGPGNNGGDGFVIARHLQNSGWDVDVALLGEISKLQNDALEMANMWVNKCNGEIKPFAPEIIQNQDVIVDAVFGTGLSKDISGVVEQVIEAANESDAFKIAVDIPSGIKGDTGQILGQAFKADQTITFCRLKPAHLIYPGKNYCGKTHVTDIGISDRTVDSVKPDIFLNRPAIWMDKFPIMKSDDHKYNRGHTIVVSGDMIHTGAARLAAQAALRIGAGLVSVSSPQDALSTHAAHLTSIMIRRRDQIEDDLKDTRLNSWCIGPAAGVNGATRSDVLQIVKAGKQVVLDADALSIFEDGPLELFEAINSNENLGCVLTPHTGEFSRLFPYLKSLDKISAARNAAKLSGAVVLYKGADTVIAEPEGQVVISDNAPRTLATAGSGDVLAGMITGLMAQGMDSFYAACAANWIHGECANKFGVGLISEDLIKLIPSILKGLKQQE